MRILFQGDSITDCYRIKEGDALDLRIGMGYVLMCQAELTYEEPGKYVIRKNLTKQQSAVIIPVGSMTVFTQLLQVI